jgi:uncharacterized protein with GYD domain
VIYYLIQENYTAVSAKGMIRNPTDRSVQARSLVALLGGILHFFFLSAADNGYVSICELPDEMAALALGIAAAATGGIENYRLTRPSLAEDGEKAMRLAQSAEYAPPGLVLSG